MSELNETTVFDRIRELAYEIWLREGCPEGCADRHWSVAEAEVALSHAAPDRDTNRLGKPDASDAELRANAYGQQDAQPSKTRRRA